ncbi:Monodehydroascorbate reductase 4 peroxisomal, partial [Bienertia sinuspersici]
NYNISLCIFLVPRLFTTKIADYYEEYYKSKGIKFVKGTVLTSFEFDSSKKVSSGVSHSYLMHYCCHSCHSQRWYSGPADMVVVGIGIRPNTSLFEGQLSIEKGGIKVNGKLQTSNSSVYAVGDVAAFPVRLFGEIRRLEHVDSARKTARHAVTAIMEPEKTDDFDYLPFFYSRVFGLSWQFYGDNAGEAVHFGDYSGKSFGAYWVKDGQLVGSFLEGGNKEEYEALARATWLKPSVENVAELEKKGLSFATEICQRSPSSPPNVGVESSVTVVHKPIHVWHATAGVIFAASIAGFAYWYGRRRKRW